MAPKTRSMGPAQVIAWLLALVLAFLGLIIGLLAFYRTELLQRRMKQVEEEKQNRQTELMVEIRDLLREQRDAPADTGIYLIEPESPLRLHYD
jgi:large-conductance mechanosensitive channel